MAEFQRMMVEIQKSHIEANVPNKLNFEAYLSRDLNNYFASNEKTIEVNYELLRDEPTQSGVAYPKYYLWAVVRSDNQVIIQGAARVAAVEKTHFKIYEFLSKSEIRKNPKNAAKVFPRLLLSKIYKLAEVQ